LLLLGPVFRFYGDFGTGPKIEHSFFEKKPKNMGARGPVRGAQDPFFDLGGDLTIETGLGT
jgi:hypothetical protein